jgi:CBS domain containing-hemolysin-like protein
MTPRTEIEALEFTNDLGAVTALIRKVGHSRIPVYEGSLDHVVGIFYVKDLMKWLAGDASGQRQSSPPAAGAAPARRTGFDLRSILRPAIFVPETKTVRELLRELVVKKVHIAMVADEYGGTAGLVTIEDIVEEVFGEIQDEYEFAKDEVPRVDINVEDRIADVDARTYVHDVNDALEPLGVALPEGDEYDTLGGFVITTLGRIPQEGESFQHDRVNLNVLEASPTRVLRVRLEVKPQEQSDGAAPGEGASSANGRPSVQT